MYEFAYVFPKGVLDGDKIAVIKSYNSNVDENLSSGILDIPNKVDAYKHFEPGTGAGSGYVAVNYKDQFMFYKVLEPVLDEYGNKIYGEYEDLIGEDGNPVVDSFSSLYLRSDRCIHTHSKTILHSCNSVCFVNYTSCLFCCFFGNKTTS